VKLLQIEPAIYRLIHRHGGSYWDERVLKLIIHDNPDGSGPVWRHFRLRSEHRRLQGIIHGKAVWNYAESWARSATGDCREGEGLVLKARLHPRWMAKSVTVAK